MARSIVRCLANVVAVRTNFQQFASWPDHWPPYAINTYTLTAYHDRYVDGTLVETVAYATGEITYRTSSWTAPVNCPWPNKKAFLKSNMPALWEIYQNDNPNDKFDQILFYSNGGCGIDMVEGRGWQYDPDVEDVPPDGVDPFRDPYGPSFDPNNPPPQLPDGRDECPAGFDAWIYLQEDPDDGHPIITSNNCYTWAVDLTNPCNSETPPNCAFSIPLQPTAAQTVAAARNVLACLGLPELDDCLTGGGGDGGGGNGTGSRPTLAANRYRRGLRSMGRSGYYVGGIA